MTNTIFRNLLISFVLAGSPLAPLLAEEATGLDSGGSSEIQFGGRQLNGEGLADLRGGAVKNEQTLDGLVRDNQAYNLTTGGNLISEGAFAGSSGLATVIQNSGNNVLIQNSTIVNVQFK